LPKTLSIAVLLTASLTACTVMHDRGPMNPETQDIQVDVMPETAQCEARQAATPSGIYDPGRRVLTVAKSRDSLEILCSATGYKDKRVVLLPGDNALGSVGFLLSDFGPVDYFYSSYPGQVTIAMQPLDVSGQTR
jgi:hypothetical protein